MSTPFAYNAIDSIIYGGKSYENCDRSLTGDFGTDSQKSFWDQKREKEEQVSLVPSRTCER